MSQTINSILNVLYLPTQSLYSHICRNVFSRTAWHIGNTWFPLRPLLHFSPTRRKRSGFGCKQQRDWSRDATESNRQGTASINLCVEIKASHTWKAGSPWFPLERGLVAMGVERRYWRRKNTERQAGRQCHLSTHNTQSCTVYFASSLEKNCCCHNLTLKVIRKETSYYVFLLYLIKDSCVQFEMFDEIKSSPPHLKHEVCRGRLFA